MATAPTVKVEGLKELLATMRKAGVDMADMKRANQSAGRTVASWAGVTAPRRSGALGMSVRPANQVGRARVMAGGSSVPYAGPIHWGWPARSISAQPFISAAAQATESAWVEQYLNELQQIIDGIRGA